MSKFNPVGKRADKYSLRSPSANGGEGEDDGYRRIEADGPGEVTKEIQHFTMTCPACGAAGRYDELREVVCPDCGVVISGDKKPLMYDEFANNESSNTKEREDTGRDGPMFPG